jgi:hypothetical protein
MSAELTIRPFTEQDSIQVRELFVAVNRLFSPPDRRAAFEAYIERSLSEEIDRISDYYSDRNGGFWVAVRSDKVIGFFGLERVSGDAMELRRMYVDLRRADRVSLGGCFNSRKIKPVAGKHLDLSLARPNYKMQRWHYTGVKNIRLSAKKT